MNYCTGQVNHKFEIKKIVLSKLAYLGEVSDEEIQNIIDDCIIEYSQETFLDVSKKQTLKLELFNGIRKYDVLQELIDNNEISEIMINGWKTIFIESHGRIEKWDKHFESKEKLEDVIQQMVSRSNRMVNEE